MIANGFNPAMAKDLIARRRDLRDEFAMAALQGGYEAEEAFRIADKCLEWRNA